MNRALVPAPLPPQPTPDLTIRLQAIVIAQADVTGGVVNAACHQSVSGAPCKAALWALWAHQLEHGEDARIICRELERLAACAESRIYLALIRLQRLGVLTNMTPRAKRNRGGSAWRINWERLVELVPAEPTARLVCRTTERRRNAHARSAA